jgi:hypothetical protein
MYEKIIWSYEAFAKYSFENPNRMKKNPVRAVPAILMI